jgi:ribonuclease D
MTVAELAHAHTMPTENLLPPDAVRRISWEPPDPPEAEAVATALAAYGARPWQVELTAGPIAGAFAELDGTGTI